MNLRFPPEIRRLPISEEMVVYLFTSVELVNKPVNTAVAYEKGCDMLKAFEFTANFTRMPSPKSTISSFRYEFVL